MRFSEAWLREWVNPDVSTEELADQLSMAGLEVDAVEPAAAAFSGVVVGKVLSREPHPDADKLSVCTVDVAGDEPLQIVCGAKNVAAGMTVPVAVVGARLPGDFKIKKAKLRGVQSMGMICSASELGLEESSEGIMPLPDDAPVGADLRDYLQLDDQCIEVDLTPDRGDCLGVAGIAREVGVINQSPLTPPAIEPVAAQIDDQFPVKLLARAACPRYLCRVVRGIRADAETPLWMAERLRRSGLRPIHPVVDITNYVMLELGQPMHGFDLAKLDSEIRVRMAEAGERMTLLDGTEIELRDDSLLIADASRPLALAGIMGGEDSGVTESTVDVLFESAFFAPTAIIGKARSFGLHTDSSHRFERGVDFTLQQQAMERATALLLEIAGGQPGPLVEQVSEADLPQIQPIALRRERVARMLGVQIEDAQIIDILERLGMQVVASDDGWQVSPPSARFDVRIEVDLIEEIGRIYGYSNIPSVRSLIRMDMHPQPEDRFDLMRAKLLLVARDYQEAISYSFISPEVCEQLAPGEEQIRLANPISADMAVMRPTLWAGLIQAARHNQARQVERLRLFESGLRFRRVNGEIEQTPMLAGLIAGPAAAEQWAEPARKVDFFDLKGDVEAILALTGDAASFRFEAAEQPALHPGQSARLLRNGQPTGWLGMLHPQLEKSLDFAGHCYLFEIELPGLERGGLPSFVPLSKFPSIRRDLAIVVGRDLPAQQVLDCAKKAAPATVQDIRLFDVYTGEKIDSGLKSLALSLILQDSSKTLTDDEVEQASQQVLTALSSELDAQLRD